MSTSKSSAKGDARESFAPNKIITATGGTAVDVTKIKAIGSPDEYEYFHDGNTAQKITRSGVLWINAKTKSVTFTATANFEVMSTPDE